MMDSGWVRGGGDLRGVGESGSVVLDEGRIYLTG